MEICTWVKNAIINLLASAVVLKLATFVVFSDEMHGVTYLAAKTKTSAVLRY